MPVSEETSQQPTGGDREPEQPTIAEGLEMTEEPLQAADGEAPAETADEYARRMMREKGMTAESSENALPGPIPETPPPASSDGQASDKHVSSALISPKVTDPTQSRMVDDSMKVTAQYSETIGTITAG